MSSKPTLEVRQAGLPRTHRRRPARYYAAAGHLRADVGLRSPRRGRGNPSPLGCHRNQLPTRRRRSPAGSCQPGLGMVDLGRRRMVPAGSSAGDAEAGPSAADAAPYVHTHSGPSISLQYGDRPGGSLIRPYLETVRAAVAAAVEESLAAGVPGHARPGPPAAATWPATAICSSPAAGGSSAATIPRRRPMIPFWLAVSATTTTNAWPRGQLCLSSDDPRRRQSADLARLCRGDARNGRAGHRRVRRACSCWGRPANSGRGGDTMIAPPWPTPTAASSVMPRCPRWKGCCRRARGLDSPRPSTRAPRWPPGRKRRVAAAARSPSGARKRRVAAEGLALGRRAGRRIANIAKTPPRPNACADAFHLRAEPGRRADVPPAACGSGGWATPW